jgi:sporulation protein YlmC with PRC-barrel domain
MIHMLAKTLTVAALGLALSTAAFAQSSQSSQNSQNTQSQSSNSSQDSGQNASAMGQWQASKLIGLNVYNDTNDKIGDIKELLIDRSGKIDSVAVGVGGVLGMGEHDVAVKFEQLKWVDTPVQSSSASNNNANGGNSNANSSTASTNGSAASGDASKSNRNYPDHALLSANKDQLKAMPQFNYNK